MLKLVSVICSLTDPNMSMSTYVNQALVNKQIINHKSVPKLLPTSKASVRPREALVGPW